MVENIKKVLEAATMHTRICANPQRGAYVWTEWLTWVTDALGVWFAPSCMMHKKNISKDCDRRDNNNDHYDNDNNNFMVGFIAVNISRGWYSYPLLIIRTQNVGFCEWIKENQYNYNSVLIVRKYIIYSNFLSKKYTMSAFFSVFKT